MSNNIKYCFYQNKADTPEWFLTSCDTSNYTDTEGSVTLPSYLGLYNEEKYTYYPYNLYNYCFYGEDKITEIGIPSSIKTIGQKAFARSSIKIIRFYSSESPQISSTAFDDILDDLVIYVPKGYRNNGYHTQELITALGGETAWNEIVQEGDFSVSSGKYIAPLTLYGITGQDSYYIETNVEDVGMMALWQTEKTANISTSVIGGSNLVEVNDNKNIISYNQGAHLYRTDAKSTNFNSLLNTDILYDSIASNAVYGSHATTVTLNAKRVMSLGFQNCQHINKIIITNNVEYISPYAFLNCPNITTILNASSAFEVIKNTYLIHKETKTLCAVYNRKNGDFSASTIQNILQKISEIPSYSFYNISSLNASITIPEHITRIGAYAFANTSLTGLTVAARTKKLIIDDYAFYACNNLTNIFFAGGSVNANYLSFGGAADTNRVVTIGEAHNRLLNTILATTFSPDNQNITVLVLDNEEMYNKYYEDEVWGNYIDLSYSQIRNYEFEDGIEVIDSSFGLSNNPYLQTVTIPSSVKTITHQAFKNCTALYNVIFKEPAEGEEEYDLTIANEAFSGCSALYTITLPKRLVSITNKAFENCYKMVEILNLSSIDLNSAIGKKEQVGGLCQFLSSSSCIITRKESSRLTTDETGNVFYFGEKRNELLQRIDKTVHTSALGGIGYMDIVFVQSSIKKADGTVEDTSHNRIREIDDNGVEKWYIQDVYTPIEKEIGLNSTDWSNKVTSLKTYWGTSHDEFDIICQRDVSSDELCKGFKYNATIGKYIWNDQKKIPYLVHIAPHGTDARIAELPIAYQLSSNTAVSEYNVYDYLLYNRTDIERLIIPNGAQIKYICPYAFAENKNLTEIYYGTNAELISQEERHDNDEYIWKNHIFSNAGKNGPGIKLTIGTEVSIIRSNLFHPDGRASLTSNYPKLVNLDFVNKNNELMSQDAIITNYQNAKMAKIDTMAFLGIPTLQQCYLNERIEDNFAALSFQGTSTLYEFWGASDKLKVMQGKDGPNNSQVVKNALIFYDSYDESSALEPIDDNFIFDTSNNEMWNLVRYIDEEPSIVLPEKTKVSNHEYRLNDNLFNNALYLQQITFNSMIVRIGAKAFGDCKNLISVNGLAPTLRTIGESGFYNCTSLISINLADTQITEIPKSCFQKCSQLRDLYLPETIGNIGRDALNGCNSLTKLIIPANIKYIDNYGLWFGGNTETKKVEFIIKAATPPSITNKTFDTARVKRIIVPKGSMELYLSSDNWCALEEFMQEAKEES